MMFSCTDETQISSCSNAGYHITSLIFYLMASGMANNYMKVSCKRTGKLRNGPKHWIYEDFGRLLQGPCEPSDHTKQTKSAITFRENAELETTWQSQFLAERSHGLRLAHGAE